MGFERLSKSLLKKKKELRYCLLTLVFEFVSVFLLFFFFVLPPSSPFLLTHN